MLGAQVTCMAILLAWCWRHLASMERITPVADCCALTPVMLPAAGLPLQPNTPLNIISPNGTYVRTDNTSSPATAGSGSGGTTPEQYLAFHPGNLTSTSPVQLYDTAVLQSVQTGLWCRLAPLPSNATQLGMVCDQPSAATGTLLTYTGDGLSYNGIDLVATGPGKPLLLENTTTAPVAGPTADNLTLAPAPVGEYDVSVHVPVCM